MTDRVVIGKVNDLKSGFWASKAGTDVKHLIDGTIPADDWYGHQQEWDWKGLGGTAFAQNDPGETGNTDWTSSGSGIDHSRYSCYNFNHHGDPAKTGKLKRTSNGTVLYTGAYDDDVFRTPYWVTDLTSLKPSYEAFIGDDYSIVEARIRRLPSPHPPVDSQGVAFVIFYRHRNTDGTAPHGAHEGLGNLRVTSVDGTPTNFSSGGTVETYKEIFPDAEVNIEPSDWKVLEWDASNENQSGNEHWLAGLPGGVGSESRIVSLRFDFTHGTDPGGVTEENPAWDPETDPMWEIDYIRVKKPTVPINSGRWNSKQGAMIFDSDVNRTGLVHASGTVTIGTQKAFINGATSGYVAGFHDGTQISNGYVSFPELPYIPLVLFQRIDEHGAVTGSSYPGGEEEFSICTQNWEDHRYPTIDLVTSESKYKSFDIKTVEKVNSAAYFVTSGERTGNIEPMHENFYSYTSTSGANKLTAEGTTALDHYKIGDFTLPWTTPIPAQSNRAGKKFSDMVQSFSEARTFAYARAAKDHFWLTCRNAIAQEGLEPALNLAPVMPEKGLQDRGNSALASASSNNDGGAWGMFHPALALYDGKKFTEGLQLKWDSRMTANSMLLSKIGSDYQKVGYPQYRWNPSFSCSGLPFNGTLVGPNGPAPTDKNVFPMAYVNQTANPNEPRGGVGSYTANGVLRGDTGGFYPYRYQCNEWFHENIEDGTVHSTGIQYNIKRLSSQGIFHPHGVVPETSLAYDNKNTDFVDVKPGTTSNVFNQTAYIGGAPNKRISGIHVHTLDIRTDEKWPVEPQKSYFDFGGQKEHFHEEKTPFFCLSPPGVSPESILYTTGYHLPSYKGGTLDGYHDHGESVSTGRFIRTDLDCGGELMIANIDGTNPRIFHDNRWEFPGTPPATTANFYNSGPFAFGLTGASSPNPGSGGASQHRHITWAPDGKSILYDSSSAALFRAYDRVYAPARKGNIQSIGVVDVSYRDVPGDEIYIKSRPGGPHTYQISIRDASGTISNECSGEAPRVNQDGLAHLIYITGQGIIGGNYFTGEPASHLTHYHGYNGSGHNAREGELTNRMCDGIAYLWSGTGLGTNGDPDITNLGFPFSEGIHPYESPAGGAGNAYVRGGLRLGYPIWMACRSFHESGGAATVGWYQTEGDQYGFLDIWNSNVEASIAGGDLTRHFTAPVAYSVFNYFYNSITGDGLSPNSRDSQGLDMTAMDAKGGAIPVFVPGTNGEWITWNGWAYNIGPRPMEVSEYHTGASGFTWANYNTDKTLFHQHPHARQGPDPRAEQVSNPGNWTGHLEYPKGDGWMGRHANSLFAATSLDPVTQQGAGIGTTAFSWDGTKVAWSDGRDIQIGDFPGMDAIVSENQSAPPREGTVGITNIRNLTQNGPNDKSYSPLFNAADTKVFFITKRTESNEGNVDILGYDIQYSDVYPEQVTYDPDMAHPPKYKYWVLRVPVSFPEYT